MTEIQFIIENTKNLVTLTDIENELRFKISSIDEAVENIPSVNPEKVLHLHSDITIIDSIFLELEEMNIKTYIGRLLNLCFNC